MSPLYQAAAYSTFANQGLRRTPQMCIRDRWTCDAKLAASGHNAEIHLIQQTH